ncbi:DUF5060 domain-containing protein [bacterium]|nr:DUF5060 domain-containing protein [bacterium]
MKTKWRMLLCLTALTVPFAGQGEASAGTPSSAQATPSVSVLQTNTDRPGLYTKFEAVLKLQNASYSNPYDPTQIDVRASFISPSGRVWPVFAFYDNFQNRNQWKVRFSPNETGRWRYTLTAKTPAGTGTSPEYLFDAVPSALHGWIRVSPDNPHYLMHDDGTSFYGVGPAYPWGVNDGPAGLAQLEACGANLFYYWNITYGGEGNLIESLASGLGRYDQAKCGRIDQILEWSEARGLHMILSIWPHDLLCANVSGWPKAWNINPYNLICDPAEFFWSLDAWDFEISQYRYLIARWGHSRSLAAWESVCEINGTDGWAFDDRAVVLDWTERVHRFFRENDTYGRPTTVSQGGGQYWSDGYRVVDLPNVHLYERSWAARYPNNPLRSSLWLYGDLAGRLGRDFDKPCIFGEAGATDTYGGFAAGSEEYLRLFHNALWVTWASGLAAAPLWWDFGTKSIFTEALLEQMRVFASVSRTLDYAHLPLAAADVSVEGCDGYALEADTVAFGWIRQMNGAALTPSRFTLSGMADGAYDVTWLDTWTGDTIGKDIRLSAAGLLAAGSPALPEGRADAAFVIRRAATGSAPVRLSIAADPGRLFSDPVYAADILCFILDRDGRLCAAASNPVRFTVSGPGVLEGANPAVPSGGSAAVVLRAGETSGTCTVIASSDGLEPDTLDVVIQKFGSIDDFEEYGSDGDLRAAWAVRMGTTTAAFLETEGAMEGRNAMRIEYTLGNGSLSYAGLSRTLSGDLSRIGSLRFRMKPDGSGRTLHIRLQETDTKYWYADRVLNGTDPEIVTLPLEAFAPNVGTARPNTAALTRIGLNVTIGNAGSGSGSLVFDDMKFLAAPSAVRHPASPHAEPAGFLLRQAYPNPFNEATTFEIRLPAGGDARMTVFDTLGRVIRAWTVPDLPAGPTRIRWGAEGLASGVYLLRVDAGGFSQARKCVLMR